VRSPLTTPYDFTVVEWIISMAPPPSRPGLSTSDLPENHRVPLILDNISLRYPLIHLSVHPARMRTGLDDARPDISDGCPPALTQVSLPPTSPSISPSTAGTVPCFRERVTEVERMSPESHFLASIGIRERALELRMEWSPLPSQGNDPGSPGIICARPRSNVSRSRESNLISALTAIPYAF
jgi:hypothetical protein